MSSGSSGGAGRRFSWRIGRLVCGLAAVTAAMAGLVVVASAQPPPGTGNPTLRTGCGLRVLLVLDNSGSVAEHPNGIQDTRAAALAFAESLEGTGSELGMTKFSQRAFALRANADGTLITSPTANTPENNTVLATPTYHPVTPSTVSSTFAPFIDRYNPSSGLGTSNPETLLNDATNWQAALSSATLTPATEPDLVLFVTDGDPTVAGFPTPTAPTGPPTETGFNTNTAAAVPVAQAVKGQGTRIFALGVGAALAGATSEERLQAISGPTRLNPPTVPLRQADWEIQPDFALLKSELAGIVSDLCAPSLTVTKQVLSHHPDLVEPAAGFTFHTTLGETGGHRWVMPTTATDHTETGPTASVTTGANGIARFEWALTHPHEHTVSVEHVPRAGWDFVVAQCRTVHPDGSTSQEETSYTGIPTGTLASDDFRTCTVTNRQHTANLTVVKHLEPTSDPGRFNLEVNGEVRQRDVPHGGSTGQMTLPLGTYTVSESGGTEADGTQTNLGGYSSSIRCVDVADGDRLVAEGPGTSIPVHLTSQAENIVCTITNISTTHGQITVIKHLIPDTDSGTFNLHIGSHQTPHPVGDGGALGPVPLPFGTYEITETGANGTDLSHYNINTTCINERTGEQVAQNAHGPSVSVHLSEAANYIQCTITNARPGVRLAHLEVVKHLVPHDDAGTFDLLIGGKAFAIEVGHNGTTGPLEFEVGTHAVTEHAAGLTRLADFSISTTCVDRAHAGHTVAHNPHGPSVSVHLTSESDNIVCTITNTRTAPPPEGGGEVAVPDVPAPHLSVVKTMAPHAQVNELVPITVTVHNYGHGTAHGVQLAETPPAGLRIVHVADHGTIQHGIAVWHLGNLAHLESRTVHATARVLHAGLHVDTAVATALNADPALSNAALRAPVRRPPPPPPRFTG